MTNQERFGEALRVFTQHRGTEPYQAVITMLQASIESMKDKMLTVEAADVAKVQGGAAQMNYLLDRIAAAAQLANEPMEG